MKRLSCRANASEGSASCPQTCRSPHTPCSTQIRLRKDVPHQSEPVQSRNWDTFGGGQQYSPCLSTESRQPVEAQPGQRYGKQTLLSSAYLTRTSCESHVRNRLASANPKVVCAEGATLYSRLTRLPDAFEAILSDWRTGSAYRPEDRQRQDLGEPTVRDLWEDNRKRSIRGNDNLRLDFSRSTSILLARRATVTKDDLTTVYDPETGWEKERGVMN